MKTIKKIKDNAEKEVENELNKNRKILIEKKSELTSEKELLFTVEEKWLKNEIDPDTYSRWHNKYKNNIENTQVWAENGFTRYKTD